MSILQVKKLSESAKLPSRSTEGSVGYDLFSAEDKTIKAYGKALLKTDLSIAIPEGYYGRIAPRSSLGWKHHIDVGGGVIDQDYRGPLGVILYNHSNENYTVSTGDRIAQLIFEKIGIFEIIQVDELDDTQRGEKGFGSTGK